MKETEARESSPGQQLECKRKRIKILERTRAAINDKISLGRLNKKDHLQIITGLWPKDRLGGILTARMNSSQLRTWSRCYTVFFEGQIYNGVPSLPSHKFKVVYDKKLLCLVGQAPLNKLGRQTIWKHTTCEYQ